MQRHTRIVCIVGTALMLCALVVGSGGCAGGGRAELATAVDTYSAVGLTLHQYHNTGRISDGRWETIRTIDSAAYAALMEWHAAVIAGEPWEEAASRWQNAMDRLLQERLLAEGGLTSG